MLSNNTRRNIEWPQFEACNLDTQKAFEMMCRLLFNRCFFSNKAVFCAIPNNPGIEVHPKYSKELDARISFQAKYFISKLDYKQIEKSIDKTIEHYAGQLDLLYLYCNLDIVDTCKPMQRIRRKLDIAEIKLELITNQSILEQVHSYSNIASYYFHQHGLEDDWFNNQMQLSLDSLGPRYNKLFNIDTLTGTNISLFSQDQRAVAYINAKRENAVLELEAKKWHFREYSNYFQKAYNAVKLISEVTTGNICESLNWQSKVRDSLVDDIIFFCDSRIKKEDELNQYQNLLKEAIEKYRKNEPAKTGEQERRELNDKINQLRQEIFDLEYLIDLPLLLEITEKEQRLLLAKALIIEGEWGVGKTQLLATTADRIIKSGGNAILLQGNSFLTSDSILQQIPSVLGLNCEVDELLSVFETVGEQKQQCVLICIDAVNESANKNIWKTGLLQLYSKIIKFKFVRLVISVRSGYAQFVFDDAFQEKTEQGEIAQLVHPGFDEGFFDATKTFLDYYNIPFAPTYYLQYEMGNPLFLTLFCQVYDGRDLDLVSVFEKVIEKADHDARKAVGMEESMPVLNDFIEEFADQQITNERRVLDKNEILKLKFWGQHGLNHLKLQFITALEKIGIIYQFASSKMEFYDLGFNKLSDFVCARQIMRKFPQKCILKLYLKYGLLKNGRKIDQSKIDIFIVACSLYAEKFGEECISIIQKFNTNYVNHVMEGYLSSYIWRKTTCVNRDQFLNVAKTYNVRADMLYQVFIGNSTKLNHPLNSESLHTLLLNKSISQRDSSWTVYINHISPYEERIYQLVDLYLSGKKLTGLTDESLWLLLLMFSWLLTSSNRILRDKTSKALVELLKCNFAMCKRLLEKFETVNDPYIIQRLYGIVFGACLKRCSNNKIEYDNLSEYIYRSIFCKDIVYPDILLRDYAQLILERYFFEFPSELCRFCTEKIRPPYKSQKITVVDKQDYYDKNSSNSGFNAIDWSMRPNCEGTPGMYGDFGRYIFQAAATKFIGADMVNLYHYAMQFIRDELGYNDTLFSRYDSSLQSYSYDRNNVKKIERIGKKYQWIALFNVLARLSDEYSFDNWGEDSSLFLGAWQLYIRDFDPTQNGHLINETVLPSFAKANRFDDFLTIPVADKTSIYDWVKEDCSYFAEHAMKLEFVDSCGQSWILLNQHENIQNELEADEEHTSGFSEGSQDIWSMSHGYFARKDDFRKFKANLENANFMGRWFPEASTIHQIFLREYPWAPICNYGQECSWINYEVETEGSGEIKLKIPQIELLFRSKQNDEDIDRVFVEEDQDWEIYNKRKVVFGQVLPTYCEVSWESEYDASQQESVGFDVPCKEIVEFLHLEQKGNDGYFFNNANDLIAFDGTASNVADGLLIRKDYLINFLEENELSLFWVCLGEKQYFQGSMQQIWSEWSGFLYFHENNITGTMNIKECRSSPHSN